MLKIHFSELRQRAPQKMLFHAGVKELDRDFSDKRGYYSYLRQMELNALHHLSELFAIQSQIVDLRAQLALFLPCHILHQVQKKLRAFEHFVGNALSHKNTYYAPCLFWGLFSAQSAELKVVLRLMAETVKKKAYSPILWQINALQNRIIQFQQNIKKVKPFEVTDSRGQRLIYKVS